MTFPSLIEVALGTLFVLSETDQCEARKSEAICKSNQRLQEQKFTIVLAICGDLTSILFLCNCSISGLINVSVIRKHGCCIKIYGEIL